MSAITRREALRRLALLTGGALSASTVAGLVGGCRADPGQATGSLTRQQGELLGDLAELIIPTTDTPGAREAGVPAFIDRMLHDWYLTVEREHFLEGLDGVEALAQSEYGRSFTALGTPEQTALLQRIAEESNIATQEEIQVEAATAWRDPHFPGRQPIPGTGQREVVQATLRPFFRTLKELTVVGYYTSEIGGTQELRYVHTPGRYNGCIPSGELGRAWI